MTLNIYIYMYIYVYIPRSIYLHGYQRPKQWIIGIDIIATSAGSLPPLFHFPYAPLDSLHYSRRYDHCHCTPPLKPGMVDLYPRGFAELLLSPTIPLVKSTVVDH